jgi:hypothetical protein
MNIETNGIALEVGDTYECVANDIVNEWSVNLMYLGSSLWSHPTENHEGSYPAIVHEVAKHAERNDCTLSAPCGQCIACDIVIK